MWKILGIEETKDKKAIKEAYLKKVKDTNPEDKPEEFKMLREAYEQALAYCDNEDALCSNSFESEMLKTFDELYFNMKRRCDINEWKELLSSSAFNDFSTANAAKDMLILYIDEHWRLPLDVMKYLVDALEMDENYEHVVELVGERSADWFLYDVSCAPRRLPPELFMPGINGEECDEYDELFSSINDENEKETIEILSHFSESHPYAQMSILSYRSSLGEDVEKEMEEIVNQFPNDWQIHETYIHHFDANKSMDRICEAFNSIDDGRFDDLSKFHLVKGYIYEGKENTVEALRGFNEAMYLSRIGSAVYNEARGEYNEMAEKLLNEINDKGIGNIEDNMILYEAFYAASNRDKDDLALEICDYIRMDELSDYQKAMLQMNVGVIKNGEDNIDSALFQRTYDAICAIKDDSRENHRILRRKNHIMRNIILNDAKKNDSNMEQVFKKVLEQTGESFEVMLKLVMYYVGEKRYDKALDYANHTLKSAPYNDLAVFNKAFVLFEKNEAGKSLRLLNFALNLNRYNFPAIMLKLLIMSIYGEYDSANEILKEYKEERLEETIIGSYCKALIKYKSENDCEGAKAILDKILPNIDRAELPYQKSRILFTAACVEEKLLDMNKAESYNILLERAETIIAEDPQHLGALALKARMLKRLHRNEEMLDVLYHMKEIPDHSAWVEQQIGFEYNRTIAENPQRVIDIFKEAYANEPDEISPWYMGNGYLRLGKYEEALSMYELELENYDEDADAYVGKADVYMMMREYEKALVEINHAIDLVKENGNANGSIVYNVKYRILVRMGRFDEALAFVKEAIGYGNYRDGNGNLMRAYQLVGRPDEGNEYIRNVFTESKEKDLDAGYSLMISYLNKNDVNNAQNILKKCKSTLKQSSYNYWENILREFTLDFDGMIRYYLDQLKNKNEEKDDCSLEYDNIAVNYYRKGRFAEAKYYAELAIKHCNRELEKYILDRPLYLTRKIRPLMILGKEVEAREILKQARDLPLCRNCDHHFCKDALNFEVFLEEAKHNYEKAAQLCQQGIDSGTSETDFVSDLNRIRKKMEKK